jgi:solute carrier family 25 oxoglutarate transporter 11
MVKNEGIKSIYSGLSAALARQCVYGTARIGLHRTFSDYLQKRNDGKTLNFGYKALSGMGSGSLAVCLGTPFDVALVRMQADSMKAKELRRGYKNVVDALLRVSREEGFSKLYSGLAPNILRGMSINVGMLACYDQAKESLGSYVFQDPIGKPPSTQTQLGASLIAGFTATACSLPFDLLKSRMQDGSKYKGISDAIVQIYTKEGFLSFWTGFGAYYMRTAPHAMILLMTTQPITDYYKKHLM